MVRGIGCWLLAGALAAQAGDGVTELSQQMMPVVITEPGAYRLTEDLVGASGASGITVTTNDVAIDLGGYSLRGVSGSWHGVYVPTNLAVRNLSVRNGSIVNWGQSGVSAFAATNGSYRDLLVASNGYLVVTNFDGMWVGTASLVTDCRFVRNDRAGVEAESGSTVVRCLSIGNHDHGYDLHSSSVIEDCIATDNGHDGFHLSKAVTARRLTAVGNGTNVAGGAGIEIDMGSVAEDCVASGNGDDGFKCNGRATFIRCAADGNFDDGYDFEGNPNIALIECTARDNGITRTNGTAAGYHIGPYSVVRRCLAVNNGNGLGNSGGFRIAGTDKGILLEDNTAASNRPFGFRIQGETNLLVGNMAYGNVTNYLETGPGNMMPLSSNPGGAMPNTAWINFDL